ncbi:hypothetical protein [Streptomyces sp. bgisy153]|uniref:hypothetical protein n=1 Tax=Streptomyces sp. bgisy153 TaxID=3413793 RepID=UPI003D72FE00
MTAWWPTRQYHGLHVDLGDYHTVRNVWLRLPVATFTCPRGCHEVAVGVHDVADLTARIRVTDHARTCPGPNPKESRHG